MAKFTTFGKDIKVSTDSRVTGLNNNVCVIGTSGAGKTGSFIVPNLASTDESIIVADTKGNLHRMFSDDLAERGYKVYVMDFKNPERSVHYNPLMYIRKDDIGSYNISDIQKITNALVPLLDQKEPFWDSAARKYISFLIAYVLEFYPENQKDISSVVDAHQKMTDVDFKAQMELNILKNPDSFAARKYNEVMQTAAADKTWACIYEFASNALNVFNSKAVKALVSGENSIDISAIGKEKSALFVNISDTDRSVDNLVNLFYTQALQVLCDTADNNLCSRLDVPVKFYLDDFATNTRIEDFDKIIAVIRSRLISCTIIIQSMSQLRSLYNDSVADTIINNCDHILFLGCNDYRTAEYVASRAFTSPETVLVMPRTQAYLLASGQKGRLIEKIVPYSTLSDIRSSEFEFEQMEESIYSA